MKRCIIVRSTRYGQEYFTGRNGVWSGKRAQAYVYVSERNAFRAIAKMPFRFCTVHIVE